MKKIILIIIVLFLFSCKKGNNIYFDLDKKGIISCRNSIIRKVTIKGIENNYDYYRFSLDNNELGTNFFNVKVINKMFIVTTSYGKIIKNTEFKLKPSSKYKITNISDGDAVESSVIISLNQKGVIIDANITNCN